MPTDSRRVIWSWAMYDFANSPFTTLVVTFVYATCFTQAIAADPIHGTALWSRAVTFSGKLTAFIGPFLLGVLTDVSGSQRIGVSAVLALFVAGLPLLMWVDEREGLETAARN